MCPEIRETVASIVGFAIHGPLATSAKRNDLPAFRISSHNACTSPKFPAAGSRPPHAQRTLKRYNRMMIGIGMPRIHKRTGLIDLLRRFASVSFAEQRNPATRVPYVGDPEEFVG